MTRRTTRVLALLLGWGSVSLFLLSLARPVRELVGHHWSHLVTTVIAPLALIGCVAAVGLWRGTRRED